PRPRRSSPTARPTARSAARSSWPRSRASACARWSRTAIASWCPRLRGPSPPPRPPAPPRRRAEATVDGRARTRARTGAKERSRDPAGCRCTGMYTYRPQRAMEGTAGGFLCASRLGSSEQIAPVRHSRLRGNDMVVQTFLNGGRGGSGGRVRSRRRSPSLCVRACSVDVAPIATVVAQRVDRVRAQLLPQHRIHARRHAGKAAADVDARAFVDPGAQQRCAGPQRVLHVARGGIARPGQVAVLKQPFALPALDLVAEERIVRTLALAQQQP